MLGILACPVDKGALLYFAADAALYNPRLRRLHRVDAGIPMMRADDGTPVDADAHQALLSRAADGAARPTLDAPLADLLAAD